MVFDGLGGVLNQRCSPLWGGVRASGVVSFSPLGVRGQGGIQPVVITASQSVSPGNLILLSLRAPSFTVCVSQSTSCLMLSLIQFPFPYYTPPPPTLYLHIPLAM